MNKRTVLVLSTTMMSIATAACAFCVAQSANAAETSTTTGINAIVNSSANNFSTTSSNTVTSSTAGSNTPNEGGSAFDSASVKPAKSINEDRSVHDEVPVYDTADNYKKDSEDNDEITYSRKKDFSVDNPFPNIISNDEINEKLGKNSNETDITKIYFTPTSTNGGTASKPEIVNNSELKDVPGKYTVYYVLKKFSDNEHPTDLFAIYGVAIYGAKAEDGSIYPGSEQTTKIERQSFTISVNGCTIAENIKKIINIKMPSYNNYTYFKIVYNYDPSNLKIERFKFVYGPSGSVGHLQASLSFHYSRFAPLDDAQFHFVDDLQYHAINPQGVGDEGKLKQRGNSDQHTSLSDADKQKGTLISSVPFYEIKGLNNIFN